jgi:hypothetical protein
MAPVNRSAPSTVSTSYATNQTTQTTTPATTQKPATYTPAMTRRDLDSFESNMNTSVSTYKGQELKTVRQDVAATMGSAMLDALVDPAKAQQELTRGVIGPDGQVLRPPPEPGSDREKFLKRVAAGETPTKEEIMAQADDVRKKTGASRMVWDMIYSNMLANLKAEKKQW